RATSPAGQPGQPEARNPWLGRTALIAAPRAAAPAPLALPAATRFTLPNGLKVIVVPLHALPVVTMRLAVGAGSNDEPRDKRTLAGFVAAMLVKGTQKRSGPDLADSVAAVGGVLDTTADLDDTYVSCQALAKDAVTCLKAIGETAMTPAFPAADVAAVAESIDANLRFVRDNPAALAAQHAENAYWGEDHVRGWVPTEDTVKAIARKDLVAWHKARFVPGNAVLAIAGDVDPAALRAEIDKAFGKWAGGKAPARKAFAEPAHKGLTLRLVDKPESVQSQILLIGPGVAHKDADFVAAVLVNDVLGGPAVSSRLTKALRLEGGRAYSAGSS